MLWDYLRSTSIGLAIIYIVILISSYYFTGFWRRQSCYLRLEPNNNRQVGIRILCGGPMWKELKRKAEKLKKYNWPFPLRRFRCDYVQPCYLTKEESDWIQGWRRVSSTGEFVGVRLSTGDSIGPALRARVTRERGEIVCASKRKEDGTAHAERRRRRRGRRDRERKSGGWLRRGENDATGRVANKVFIVSRTDYNARLLPFFGIQIISRSSGPQTSNQQLK